MKEKRISSRELSLFCKQLAMILKSGMTLQEGITFLREDTKDRNMKSIVEKIEAELVDYKPLHEALESVKIFPRYIIHMIQIGFVAGKLEEVLEGLATYYEKEYVLRERFKQAILQPVTLLGLFIIVLGVIIVKVLPIFNQIYRGLGSEMSGFAMGLMNVGNFITQYLIWGIVGVLLLGGIVYWTLWSGKIVIGDTKKMAITQFTSAVALMLSSGMTLEESFKEAKAVVYNKKVEERIGLCFEGNEVDESLIEKISQNELFGKWQMRLLSTAHKTGNMDEAMEKIAQSYGEEYDQWIEKWINRIEPTFVILFSVLIGGLLISVMFPLMSIMSSIG